MNKGTKMAMGKVILDHLRVSAKGIRMIHTMGWYRDHEARPSSPLFSDEYYQKILGNVAKAKMWKKYQGLWSHKLKGRKAVAHVIR